MLIQDCISSLDDATARRVLDSIARAQSASAETALTPELRRALQEFATGPETAAIPASDGDLARAALLLLADDPQQQPILTALIEGPAPTKFGAAGKRRHHRRCAVRAATVRQIRVRQRRSLEHRDRQRVD